MIHYQLPASADVYIHRSGRTARGAQDGITIALVTPKEAARYQGLQKAMDRPVPSDFPVDNTLMPAVSAYPDYSAHDSPFDSTLLPAVGACSKVMLPFNSSVNNTHMPAVSAYQCRHVL